MVRVIKFSVLPKGAEGYAPWMLTMLFSSGVGVSDSVQGRQALYRWTPVVPLLPPTHSACPDSAREVPKEEEESVLFPSPLPVLAQVPQPPTPKSRMVWTLLCLQVPLTVVSCFHLLPSHVCTRSSHPLTPSLSLRLASLSPSTCCWPLPMWPDGAPSSRSLCRRMSSFLNIVVR